ncbi:hypothetical protein [Cupriavidus basilensis]|uniref:hypothetical protein n=1 Tax=Cupriavidus basilensis TaxID=68895 RepID=UPI00157AB5A8|nr:hypothetical protein [Cupriavidus basilensis]NUA26086.1 hypothetical protein [Cupriavidus basilensis]
MGNEYAVFDQNHPDLKRRAEYRSALEAWWNRLVVQASTWDLETVKHLIVLNAAGLAGMATIMAGSKGVTPGWVGPVALFGYGLGVVSAILNMHLAARSFDLMADEVKERIILTHDLQADLTHIFDPVKRGNRINIAGQCCGWISVILAITGTCILGYGIM